MPAVDGATAGREPADGCRHGGGMAGFGNRKSPPGTAIMGAWQTRRRSRVQVGDLVMVKIDGSSWESTSMHVHPVMKR